MSIKIADRLSIIMRYKRVNTEQLAELTGKSAGAIYNAFHRDRVARKGATRQGMSYANVEEIVAALGCEIVIRDKVTGEEW